MLNLTAKLNLPWQDPEDKYWPWRLRFRYLFFTRFSTWGVVQPCWGFVLASCLETKLFRYLKGFQFLRLVSDLRVHLTNEVPYLYISQWTNPILKKGFKDCFSTKFYFFTTMVFPEKYSAYYILLTDKLSFPDCFYFLRY